MASHPSVGPRGTGRQVVRGPSPSPRDSRDWAIRSPLRSETTSRAKAERPKDSSPLGGDRSGGAAPGRRARNGWSATRPGHFLQHAVARQHRIGDPGAQPGMLMQAGHQGHAVGGSDEADGENADHHAAQAQGTADRQSFGSDLQSGPLPKRGSGTAEGVDRQDAETEPDEGDVSQHQDPRGNPGRSRDGRQGQDIEHGRGDRIEDKEQRERYRKQQREFDRGIAPAQRRVREPPIWRSMPALPPGVAAEPRETAASRAVRTGRIWRGLSKAPAASQGAAARLGRLVPGPRVAQDLEDRPVGDDGALGDDDGAVGQRCSGAQVVGGEENGAACRRGLPKRWPWQSPPAGPARRWARRPARRAGRGQHGGDTEPALFAARQPEGTLVGKMLQVMFSQQVVDDGFRPGREPIAGLSATVPATNWCSGFWNTMPGRAPITCPAAGSSSPARVSNSEVFPVPFAPSKATISPGRTARSTFVSSAAAPGLAVAEAEKRRLRRRRPAGVRLTARPIARSAGSPGPAFGKGAVLGAATAPKSLACGSGISRRDGCPPPGAWRGCASARAFSPVRTVSAPRPPGQPKTACSSVSSGSQQPRACSSGAASVRTCGVGPSRRICAVAVQHHGPAGQTGQAAPPGVLIHAVFDQDNGRPVLADGPLDSLPDGGDALGVEHRGRLIEQEQRRLGDEARGQRHPLAFPAGELGGLPQPQPARVDGAQRRVDAAGYGAGRHSPVFQRKGQFLLHVRQADRRGRVLGEDADAGGTTRPRRCPRCRFPAPAPTRTTCTATACGITPLTNCSRVDFPDAGGPENYQVLTGLQPKAHVAQDRPCSAGKFHRDIVQLHGRNHGLRLPDSRSAPGNGAGPWVGSGHQARPC